MTIINSRERLTRLFNGQETDRIPIWLLAPYHKLGCYADIYNIPCYEPITKAIEQYCDTFDRRGFNNGFCYNYNPEIKYDYKTVTENGNTRNQATLSYKDFSLTRYTSFGSGGTKTKFFVDEIEQLDKILEIPYVPPTPDFSSYFIEKDELGNKGLMMIDIGDPLLPLYGIMCAEDFSIFSLTDYDKILEFTDEMYKRVYSYYKYLLDNDVGEVFFIVGAEFAGPPLVSPMKFKEMSSRYVKGLCDLIRSYGKHSIVHYHGQLFQILDGMKDIGMDGLHTIEAPPIGDCTISQARDVLGKDTILIGNIQYDDLARLSVDEIDELVRLAIAEGRSGKFILSPSAGPYETSLTAKQVENYLAFIHAGVKYGKY